MEIRVELSQEDLALLDLIARREGSRAAAVASAIAAMREQLGRDYELAWDEWDKSGDSELWDRTIGDGVLDDDA